MKKLYTHCIYCHKKLDPNRSNKDTKLHQECRFPYLKKNKIGFFRGF